LSSYSFNCITRVWDGEYFMGRQRSGWSASSPVSRASLELLLSHFRQ
jgi:hypothetical protein